MKIAKIKNQRIQLRGVIELVELLELMQIKFFIFCSNEIRVKNRTCSYDMNLKQNMNKCGLFPEGFEQTPFLKIAN